MNKPVKLVVSYSPASIITIHKVLERYNLRHMCLIQRISESFVCLIARSILRDQTMAHPSLTEEFCCLKTRITSKIMTIYVLRQEPIIKANLIGEFIGLVLRIRSHSDVVQCWLWDRKQWLHWLIETASSPRWNWGSDNYDLEISLMVTEQSGDWLKTWLCSCTIMPPNSRCTTWTAQEILTWNLLRTDPQSTERRKPLQQAELKQPARWPSCHQT